MYFPGCVSREKLINLLRTVKQYCVLVRLLALVRVLCSVHVREFSLFLALLNTLHVLYSRPQSFVTTLWKICLTHFKVNLFDNKSLNEKAPFHHFCNVAYKERDISLFLPR